MKRLPGIIIAAMLAAPSVTAAEDPAIAMITRIEPADSGRVTVLRKDKVVEAAFMMPLVDGDEIVVETSNTSVQVRIFGGEDVHVTRDAPFRVVGEPETKSILGGMLASLSEKVFRSNQVSRRNLVTRSDAETPALLLLGFSAVPQKLVAGERGLFLRWNRDLDSAQYTIGNKATGEALAAGTTAGDFAFADEFTIEPGQAYVVRVRGPAGSEAQGEFVGVTALPSAGAADPALGTVGEALGLLDLAGQEGGAWKLEAIQGVPGLSPDDIDRATLIEEIAAL
jgi:hypothetical protein